MERTRPRRRRLQRLQRIRFRSDGLVSKGEMGFISLRIRMCVYMYFHLTRCPVNSLGDATRSNDCHAEYTGINIIFRELEKVSLHTGSNKRKCSNQACLPLILHHPVLAPTLQLQALRKCSPRRIGRKGSLCVSVQNFSQLVMLDIPSSSLWCQLMIQYSLPECSSLLVFVIDRAHERSSRGKDIVHENENSLLGC